MVSVTTRVVCATRCVGSAGPSARVAATPGAAPTSGRHRRPGAAADGSPWPSTGGQAAAVTGAFTWRMSA